MIDKDTVITGRKQAVVFIHGQGEQIPMETLTEFVDSVWVTDPKVYSSTPDSGDIKFNAIWGKPDSRNKSHELRRITTTEADNGYRTDFFSFYWADLMRGNTWQHFTGWLAGLLWRWPKRVPSDVMPVWIFLWLLTIAVLIFTINKLYPIHTILNGLGIAPKLANWFEEFNFFWFKFISVIITAVGYIGIRKLTLSFGDAARYTTAKPNNIAARQEIRERGVSLLKSLMGVDGWDDNKVRDYISKHGEMPKWDTDYDKIIVVSHSLGTIIGYDILRETFADLSKFAMPVEIDGIKTEAQPDKRRQMEEYLTNGVNKPKNKVDYDTDRYHQIQKDCFEELRSLGSPWIISDFVTLGSPLTHAEFLMSYDMDEMRHKQEARIFPTCPPTLEPNKTLKPNKNDDGYRFSYDSTYHQGDNKSLKFDHLHHAAHFAFTRWTNLYSKSKLILFGDLISGPVANHFDYAPRLKVEKEKNENNEKISLVGIRDIQVMPNETDEKNGVRTGFFTHNKYWKWRKKKQWIIENPAQPGKLPAHIRQLRSVLELTEKPD